MPTRSPQQIGHANRRAGKTWQLACAACLRASHYPNAAYEVRNGSSDIIGTGDFAVEATITTWDKIWIKLDQAGRDAKNRGLTEYGVWKKRAGKTDPNEGAMIVPAGIFWAMRADLDAYQRAETVYVDTWEKAFAAGFQAATKGEALNNDPA